MPIRPHSLQERRACYNSGDDACGIDCRKFGGDFEASCALTEGRSYTDLINEFGFPALEKIVSTEVWNSDKFKQRRLLQLLEEK